MFNGFKKLFHSTDNKPVLLSTILMRDSCSRLLGEFYEKHMDGCRYLVIVWEDKDGGISILTSENLEGIKASGMLLLGANKISNGGVR